MTSRRAQQRHEARRAFAKQQARARAAIRPLRLAVNAALKAAGFERAEEGRNGRLGYATIVSEGFLTESEVWPTDRAEHYINVRYEWRGVPTGASREYAATLVAAADAKQERLFEALEANRLFACELSGSSLKVRLAAGKTL